MTTVTHASWCTHHVHVDPALLIDGDTTEICEAKVFVAHGVEVTIEDGPDHGIVVDLYATDANLTPAQAREVAAALLTAAAIVEDAS